jgi:hypothetical protein
LRGPQAEISALKSKLEDHASEVAALKHTLVSNVPLLDGPSLDAPPRPSDGEESVLRDLLAEVLEEAGDREAYTLPEVRAT